MKSVDSVCGNLVGLNWNDPEEKFCQADRLCDLSTCIPLLDNVAVRTDQCSTEE